MKAVGMLRRETLRASRVVSMNWEDGFDPKKDGGIQTASPPSSPTHCKYCIKKKRIDQLVVVSVTTCPTDNNFFASYVFPFHFFFNSHSYISLPSLI